MCIHYGFLSQVELLMGSNTRSPRVRVVIGPLQMGRRGSASYGLREDRKRQCGPNRFRVPSLPVSLYNFSCLLDRKQQLGENPHQDLCFVPTRRLKLGVLTVIALATGQ